MNRLIPWIHDERQRLAHRYTSRELAGLTLQTTALIHEAYPRLVRTREIHWQNRAHFFAISAHLRDA